MHSFTELADNLSNYVLENFNNLQSKVSDELQKSSATSLVKNLQMIELGKTAHIVGLFSIFESYLQDCLNTQYAFQEADRRLTALNEIDLLNEFQTYRKAINTLKHGYGNSYQSLLNNSNNLNFIIKTPNSNFFEEGDVSEIHGYVKVDDKFINRCNKIMSEVCKKIL